VSRRPSPPVLPRRGRGGAELDQVEAMGEITVTWCAGQDDPTGMMASDDLIELEEEFA